MPIWSVFNFQSTWSHDPNCDYGHDEDARYVTLFPDEHAAREFMSQHDVDDDRSFTYDDTVIHYVQSGFTIQRHDNHDDVYDTFYGCDDIDDSRI